MIRRGGREATHYRSSAYRPREDSREKPPPYCDRREQICPGDSQASVRRGTPPFLDPASEPGKETRDEPLQSCRCRRPRFVRGEYRPHASGTLASPITWGGTTQTDAVCYVRNTGKSPSRSRQRSSTRAGPVSRIPVRARAWRQARRVPSRAGRRLKRGNRPAERDVLVSSGFQAGKIREVLAPSLAQHEPRSARQRIEASGRDVVRVEEELAHHDPPGGLHHSPQLAQRGLGAGDLSEHGDQVGGVEGRVRVRQPLGGARAGDNVVDPAPLGP